MRRSRVRAGLLGVLVLVACAASGCPLDRCDDCGGFFGRDLLPSPSTLDFGTVIPGKSVTLDVTLTHIGTSGTIHLQDVALEGPVADFVLTPPARMTLEAGESTTLSVTFLPTTIGQIEGALVIRHDVATRGNETRIPLTARVFYGDLIADPNPVDFGTVACGTSSDVDVVLTNYGGSPVTVSAVFLEPDDGGGRQPFTLESLVLRDGASLPVAVEAGGTLGLVLRYAAGTETTAHAFLTVQGSTDGPSQTWSFDVFGASGPCPNLVVVPDTIDLGTCGQNMSVIRVITLANTDLGTLHVASVGIVDPSPAEPVVEWAVQRQDAPGTPITAFEVPADEAVALNLEFTCKGSGGQSASATLRIVTDDPIRPVTNVPAVARCEGPPPCRVDLVPSSLDLDDTTVGTPVHKTFGLVNTSEGLCTFVHAGIADCPAGADGQPECAPPFEGEDSTVFTLSDLPSTFPNGLAAGVTYPFTVTFDPTTTGANPQAPLESFALLAVEVRDEYWNHSIRLPWTSVNGAYPPNVHGSATPAP